jgi:NAD(P)H-nitrite reductase large subunit
MLGIFSYEFKKMNEDIIVCRCQEILLSQVEEAIHLGARNLNEIKKRTRAGMGLCQGRTCSSILEKIFQTYLGINLEDIEPFTARIPVRPVALANLGSDNDVTE